MKHVDQWWDDTVVAHPPLWVETTMGIDWGESKNAYAVVGYGGHLLAEGSVEETPEGLEELLSVLRRFAHPQEPDRLAPVAIETPRRLLVSALQQAGVDVVPLNPKSVKKNREVRTARNGTKSDPTDARLIADTLRTNPQWYRTTHSPTEQARAITVLNRARDEAVIAAVRQANHIRSVLAEYHPNAVSAFSSEEMSKSLAPYWVLLDALTPAEAARLRVDGIVTRMQKPGGKRNAKGLEKTVAPRIRAAFKRPYLQYPPLVEAAFAANVRRDLEVLRAAVEHRVDLDKRLQTALEAHPYWDLLGPATGLGPVGLGGLVAELGDDPERFRTVDNLAAFAGSAPVLSESGKRGSTRRRDVKGNRLHKAMWHWGEGAYLHHPGAGYYYWTLRSKGSEHPHAIRKVMNKLLRGLLHCIKSGEVWDDNLVWRTVATPEQVKELADEVRASKRKGGKNTRPEPLPRAS